MSIHRLPIPKQEPVRTERFAEQLRARRLALGLSLKVVAGRSGIGVTTISMYEAHERDVPIERAAQWARALGMRFELREEP